MIKISTSPFLFILKINRYCLFSLIEYFPLRSPLSASKFNDLKERNTLISFTTFKMFTLAWYYFITDVGNFCFPNKWSGAHSNKSFSSSESKNTFIL